MLVSVYIYPANAMMALDRQTSYTQCIGINVCIMMCCSVRNIVWSSKRLMDGFDVIASARLVVRRRKSRSPIIITRDVRAE